MPVSTLKRGPESKQYFLRDATVRERGGGHVGADPGADQSVGLSAFPQVQARQPLRTVLPACHI